ncbi:hypothetical protein [Streptomyces sp. NPDC012888]|uniref:hypothetical protein n=1 Tax=Streptomyces sp. NPDC012888 TaxID=3364855 RepID=UPI0036A50C29
MTTTDPHSAPLPGPWAPEPQETGPAATTGTAATGHTPAGAGPLPAPVPSRPTACPGAGPVPAPVPSLPTGTPTAYPGTGAGPALPRRRSPLGALLCALLGTALLATGGLVAWRDWQEANRPPSPAELYRAAGSLWHQAPVDTLFPPVVRAAGAGPGGSDRVWTRVAVAPDAGCPDALSPEWQRALSPAGCTRVLRATYTDATRSALVSAGLVFLPPDAGAVDALRGKLPVPSGYGLTDGQRAAWAVAVAKEAPVVVYTVSAFADGRVVPQARPARDAMKPADQSPPALAGLGHAAQSVADRLEAALAAEAAPASPEHRP